MADGFRLQWKAKLVESNERRIVLLVSLTASLWLRLMGIKPGLKVAIDIPQAAYRRHFGSASTDRAGRMRAGGGRWR